ncbi:lysyl oxidase homolog 3 isoform X2 [Sceloporus undulatus]|uniref:lysyl oxidase homolog 3 isoform X2 n=1 Tax=Sceloporus undulatus TaxID=8520 RepID=UPI001C4C7C85|nr:lysyl oxidase homolog 3 isoform X2 [Sceloporus undulatus]
MTLLAPVRLVFVLQSRALPTLDLCRQASLWSLGLAERGPAPQVAALPGKERKEGPGRVQQKQRPARRPGAEVHSGAAAAEPEGPWTPPSLAAPPCLPLPGRGLAAESGVLGRQRRQQASPDDWPQERMGVHAQGAVPGVLCQALLWGAWLCLGVAAQPSTPAPSRQSTPGVPSSKLQFRLAGYPRKHNEGRIEVFYRQEWGTICDDDFSLANAHVLCRHLGFVGATGWTHSAKYGKGVGRIWLDNVNCGGNEKSLEECRSRGWGNSDCSHEEDAGVVCKDERIPGFVDSNTIETEQNQVEEVRLRPVVSHAKRPLPVAEGIVEVRHRNAWAQVCDENWDSRNSRVVCGMLGFPAEKKVNRNFYKIYSTRQQHQLNYRLHSVSCTGNEVHLSLCPFEFYKGNATGACKGGMPAVVSCVPGPLFAAGSTVQAKKRRQQQQHQRVRLKGGAKLGEGRVEVLKNGEWGTVCDDRWNLVSASVVCRELGFGSAKEALTGARMGQGMGQIHMNEVQCLGTEKSLWSCPHKNITQEGCKHAEDAAVRCNVPYMAYETTIRLSGGRSRFEGRVEVVLGAVSHGVRRWGLICGDGWGTLEAMVVCRQLGLGFANHGLQETWYWDASNVTEMALSGVKCAGHEMALTHCQHHTAVNCQRTGTRFAAGVICSETASDLLLHAPLVQETAYIEDRPLHMLYCAAEENCLSSTARNANWPYGHRRLLRFSSQIHNNGRADFRPKAGRHSWVWHECHGHYHSMDIFTHYDLLTPNGTKVAEGHKASFCLEDTECEEDVGKRYECANFGEQGITVGCWDLYRHDIDCQWIDITDVKPGNYILQVVINPRYEVAESDFTNNAMKCNCKYDGHRIWVHNCHIGDALSEEANRRFEQYPGQLNNQIA